MVVFKCGKCKSALNANGYIVLSITTSDEKNGIVMLSDKLGDYSAHFSPNLNVRQGDKSRFKCPCCGTKMGHPANENLVQIQRTDEHGVDSMIVFSSVYGEHASFEIKEENLITYGSNALKFTDPEWYLKT